MFNYEDNLYNVYFSPSNLGINFGDYKYYFVSMNDNFELEVYYSKNRIELDQSYRNNNLYYKSYGGEGTIKIAIDSTGSTHISTVDLTNSYVLVRPDRYISANHDLIALDGTVAFEACVYGSSEIVEIAGYTTLLNWDDIPMRQETYEAVTAGELEYDTVSVENDAALKTGLEILWEEAYLAAKTAGGVIDNSGAALVYFLKKGGEEPALGSEVYEEGIYGEGHTRRQISLSSAINESFEMKKTMVNKINDIMRASERLCVHENIPVTFCDRYENTGNYVNDNNDWVNTIHGYRTKTKTTVVRKGDSYEIRLRYGLEDYYDWDSNYDYTFIGFLSERLHSLYIAGYARNYTNYGYIDYTFTFQKGQTINIEN